MKPTVLGELEHLKFSVSAMAQLVGDPGSYEYENARNVARAIRESLEWCCQQLREK